MLERREVKELIVKKAGSDFPKRAELLGRANALEVLREEHGPHLAPKLITLARDRGLRARKEAETEQAENPIFALDKAAKNVMEEEPATSILAADLSHFRSSLATSARKIREGVSLEIIKGKTQKEAIATMLKNSKTSPVSVAKFSSRGDFDTNTLESHFGFYYAGEAAHKLDILDPTVDLGVFLYEFANPADNTEEFKATTIMPTHAYPGIGVIVTSILTTRSGWNGFDGKIELFATTEKAVEQAIAFADAIGVNTTLGTH